MEGESASAGADTAEDIWDVDAVQVRNEAETDIVGNIAKRQWEHEEAAERRHQEQLRAIERVQQRPRVALVTAEPSEVTVDKSRVLGQGAYAAVYAGRYANTDVAVKQLGGGSKSAPDYETQKRRFLREAETQQNIRHRNLAQLLAAVPETAQLVMELAAHGSLKDILYGPDAGRKRERLGLGTLISLRQKLAWIRDMLAGLVHLHKLKLVHRDIKADNLLLFLDGAVKIADFGLAKHMEAEASASSIGGGAKGTPMFLSPELLRPRGGEPKYEDFTDIYAAAITIIEIIMESSPFDPTIDCSVLERAIVNGGRPTLPSATPENEEILGPLLELVQQAWSSNPFERPTAQEMLDRVDELLQRAGGDPRAEIQPAAERPVSGEARSEAHGEDQGSPSTSTTESSRAYNTGEVFDFIMSTVDGVEEAEAAAYTQKLYDKKARTLTRLRKRTRDDPAFLDDVFDDDYERRDILNRLFQSEDDQKLLALPTVPGRDSLIQVARSDISPSAVRAAQEVEQQVQSAMEEEEEKTVEVLAYIYVVKKTGMLGPALSLYDAPCLIGRSKDADLRVRHSEVSRRHALLEWSNAPAVAGEVHCMFFKHLSSANGSRVNGQTVTAESAPVVLRSGDEISVLHRKFKFEYAPGQDPFNNPKATADAATQPGAASELRVTPLYGR